MDEILQYKILVGTFVFLFGITFGSFYNVVIYRLPANMSISKGRSMCFTCKHTLEVLDLVPLFSYIFLGGKCRYCKTPFSPRYFFVELLTGILFLLAFLRFYISYDFVLSCVFFSMLVVVGFIDFDTMEIYDIVLVIFSAISAIILIVEKGMQIKYNIIGAIIGFAIYYSIYFIAKIIYKQEAFGLGDVYLNAALGLVLGNQYIILASFFAFFVAIFFIIILAIFGKKFKMKQELPFGPYMCISSVIIMLYGEKLVRMYIEFLI